MATKTLRELIPLDVTTLSGVSINSGEAQALANVNDSDLGTAQPSACVTTDANKDVDGIRHLTVDGNVVVPTGIIAGTNITDGTATLTGGVFYDLDLEAATLNTSVGGTAIDSSSLSSATTKIPVSGVVKDYVDNNTSNTPILTDTFNTTGGSTLGTNTSIPATANRIVLYFNGVTINSNTRFINVEIGDASGYANKSNSALGWMASGPAIAVFYNTSGQGLVGYTGNGSPNALVINGTIILQRNSISDVWHITGGTHCAVGTGSSFMPSGWIDNTTTISRIKVTLSGGTFAAGSVDVEVYK